MRIPALLVALLCSSLIGKTNPQRKLISDKDYKYIFYVSIEPRDDYENDKSYFWFKSGKIHSSFGGSNGDLLHGQYTKSSRDNIILEQGDFKEGLKDSIWKEWYPNGRLSKIIEWKQGFKSGWSVDYNDQGEIVVSGRYRKNQKHGTWIHTESNDTIHYKHGIQKEEKEKVAFKEKLGDFLKRVFPPKENKDKKKKDRKKKDKKIKEKKKKTKKRDKKNSDQEPYSEKKG
nr:hypothetical protein [Allomuricauda sp.]